MDIIQSGGDTPAHVEESLYLIMNRFAEAQLGTVSPEERMKHFFEKTHYNSVARDEVDMKTRNKMIEAKRMIEKTLHDYPFVLSHGDFNAWNIFADHVIDFESMLYAPFGYDLITLIIHDYLFPNSDKYEIKRVVRFSKGFQERVMDRVSELVRDNFNLDLDEYLPAILLPKLTWSSALMDHRPKLQSWRFDMLNGVLDRYLTDKEVLGFIKEFPA